MGKMIRFVILIIIILSFVYLVLPPPVPLPALPDSLKSTEPGDTYQVPGVSAYFSNLDRKQVTNFYYQNFSKSQFFEIPLPTIRLNHPPEYARLAIRDQILTSYLEEYVHPFRESVLINGWEPDVYFAKNQAQREKHQIIVDGEKYFSKTTLRVFESTLLPRVMLFFSALILGFLGVKLFRKIILDF